MTATEKQLAVQRVYVRDLSFESPSAPNIFREQAQPELKLDVSTRARRLEPGYYEVVLEITIEANLKESSKPVFIAEIEQAGIFVIQGLDDQELSHALGVVCPSTLFPYARSTIDSLLNAGTFPALMLAPVNFDHMWRQSLEQQKKED